MFGKFKKMMGGKKPEEQDPIEQTAEQDSVEQPAEQSFVESPAEQPVEQQSTEQAADAVGDVIEQSTLQTDSAESNLQKTTGQEFQMAEMPASSGISENLSINPPNDFVQEENSSEIIDEIEEIDEIDEIDEIEEIDETEDGDAEESVPIMLKEQEEQEMVQLDMSNYTQTNESTKRSRQDIKDAMKQNNEAIEAKKRGKIQEAFDGFNHAISLYPKYAVAYYNRAILLTEQHKIEEAISDYSQAIEHNDRDPECLNNRGNLYLRNKDFAKARGDYDKAINLSPNYSEAYHNRGHLNVQENNLEAALQDFTRAVELNAGLTNDYFNIACIYARMGNVEKALEFLEKAYSQGYTNHDLVANDSDLAILKENPAFQDLLERWQYPQNTLVLKMNKNTTLPSIQREHWSQKFDPK